MTTFQNKDPSKKSKNFFSFLKWKLTEKKPKWPEHVLLQNEDFPPAHINENKIRISFVGHATFLIQTESLNILTDPIWSLRCSPFKHFGPKRVTEPGIRLENLPKIDIILISHNHYDHMDLETIKTLWLRDKPKIITPLKNEVILKKHIADITVETLNWHESLEISKQVKIFLEPAQHWSTRNWLDKNKALWGTFLIQNSAGAIVFIGDSGYDANIFKEIGHKFNNIIVSLIPIGAYEPRWFMKNVHMNPSEAVQTHLDLQSQYSIASHFETFQLADDHFKQATMELSEAKIKHHIVNEQFIIPKIGGVYWF